MSKLNRPTIDGFVEKLLNDQIIKENEIAEVQLSLEQASRGMLKEDIFKLVTTLNDKLDASSNELITPNGLNYAVFDNVVKEVSNTIVKEKVDREAAEIAQKEAQEAERLKDQKALEEKAERERQERINQNKKDIEDFIKNTPGAEELGLTDEEVTEIAEKEEQIERYFERQKELDELGIPEEEQDEILKEEIGITSEDLNSSEYEAANATYLLKVFNESNAKTPGEFIDGLPKSVKKAMGKKAIEDLGKSENKEKMREKIILTVVTAYKSFKDNKRNKNVEKCEIQIEANEGNIREAIYESNTTNIRLILTYLEKIEDAQIEKRKDLNKSENGLNEQNKKDKKWFIDLMTEKYLALDASVSISSLYERYKNHPRFKAFEIGFDDFLNEIENNLREHADLVDDGYYIDTLINAERLFRKTYLLEQAVDEAKEEGNEILEEDVLRNLKEEAKKEIENVKAGKERFSKRRSIDVEKHRKFYEKSMKKDPPSVKIENDIHRIKKDREEILNLSKTLGISTEDAAQRYFSSKQDRLLAYTRREREILTGKSKNNKDLKIQKQKTVKKLGIFMKEKNDALISIYTKEVEKTQKEIEEGNFDVRLFNLKWLKLEKEKSKLEIAQRRNKIISKMNKPKGAMTLLEEKTKKEFEKGIFKRYLYSGKSAYEFLEEFNKEESETNLTKIELMDIIMKGSRKYIRPEKFAAFIANEELVFFNENLLEKLRLKRQLAEKQGLTRLVEKCDAQIKGIESNLDKCKERTSEAKTTIITMDSNVRKDFVKKRDEARNESSEGTAENESGEITNNRKIKTQEFEESSIIKQGMEITTIETDEGIKPNVGAIANKNKVTFSRIKNAFSKIMELKKGKEDKQEEREAQENGVDISSEKNEFTDSEDGR